MSINISITRESKGPFRLKRTADGKYQIHSKTGGAFEGPRWMILRKSVAMGVWAKEFRYAVSQMRKLGHDVAEFGVGGGFIYSSNSNEKSAA